MKTICLFLCFVFHCRYFVRLGLSDIWVAERLLRDEGPTSEGTLFCVPLQPYVR